MVCWLTNGSIAIPNRLTGRSTRTEPSDYKTVFKFRFKLPTLPDGLYEVR